MLAPLDKEKRPSPLIIEEGPPTMPDVNKDAGQTFGAVSLNPLSPLSKPNSPSETKDSESNDSKLVSFSPNADAGDGRRQQDVALGVSSRSVEVPSNTGVSDLLSVLSSIWKTQDSIETTIVKAMAYIRRLISCERHSMFLVDFSTEELVLTTSKDLHGLRIPMSRGLVGHAVQTGEILNIEDAYSDSRFDRSVDAQTGFKTRNVLCMPIRDSNQTIVAVIQAINRISEDGSEIGFTKQDISLLSAVGESIGVAIQKAQLHIKILEEKRNVEALFDLMKAVHADEGMLGLRALTGIILKTARHLLMADNVEMYFLSPMRDELYLASSNKAVEPKHRIKVGEGIPGLVAMEGKPILLSKLSLSSKSDPKVALLIEKMPKNAHSIICMPVTTHPAKYGETVDRSAIEAVIFATRIMSSSSIIQPKQESTRLADIKDCVESIHQLARPFSADDFKALEAFCFEVARALKMHAVEAAFGSLISQGHTDPRQQALDVSFLALYTDEPTVETRESGSEKNKVTKRTSMLRAPQLETIRGTDKKKREDISKSISQSLPDTGAGTDTSFLELDFDLFSKTHHELCMYIPFVLEQFHLVSYFEIDRDALASFLCGVVEGYGIVVNPFHNFYHGWDVFRTSYFFLRSENKSSENNASSTGSAGNVGELLDKLAIFSCLIAALCHDIGHTGRNNQFEVNSGSKLALLHNDDAVLERHHAQTTMALLQRPENQGVLSNMSAEEKRRFRKISISAILGTDMTMHFKMIEECDKHSLSDANPFDNTNEDDKQFLVKCIVHSSDISGPAAPWDLAFKWGRLVMQEFSAQSAAEKELSLPVSPFMVGLDNEKSRNHLQANFIT